MYRGSGSEIITFTIYNVIVGIILLIWLLNLIIFPICVKKMNLAHIKAPEIIERYIKFLHNNKNQRPKFLQIYYVYITITYFLRFLIKNNGWFFANFLFFIPDIVFYFNIIKEIYAPALHKQLKQSVLIIYGVIGIISIVYWYSGAIFLWYDILGGILIFQLVTKLNFPYNIKENYQDQYKNFKLGIPLLFYGQRLDFQVLNLYLSLYIGGNPTLYIFCAIGLFLGILLIDIGFTHAKNGEQFTPTITNKVFPSKSFKEQQIFSSEQEKRTLNTRKSNASDKMADTQLEMSRINDAIHQIRLNNQKFTQSTETQPNSAINRNYENKSSELMKENKKAIVKSTPITDQEPTVETTPIKGQEPTVETTPITDQEPTVETTPITDQEPTVETIPIREQDPTTKSTPIVEIIPNIVCLYCGIDYNPNLTQCPECGKITKN
ncbi:hypothetical protein [Candidatus Lokiarchaeum ossiferum]|uniref:hypothetical protein n=1 Tax=Candidatus Lokiarchaeum ossiferum TaxID=2951803 RepID=UPI00352E4AC2